MNPLRVNASLLRGKNAKQSVPRSLPSLGGISGCTKNSNCQVAISKNSKMREKMRLAPWGHKMARTTATSGQMELKIGKSVQYIGTVLI